MASKEELLASLIEQQKVLTEQTEAVAVIGGEDDGKSDRNDETGQEYVYWARRGELETAGEVEVCSSTGSENPEGGDILIVDDSLQNNTEVSTSHETVHGIDTSAQGQHPHKSIEIEDCFPKVDTDQERRLEEKRETARLQEQIMNEEYQKAIGYLLCSSKSKSGKQKKKQTMTAYLFFCRRYRSKIVARNPKLSFAQISKLLSHMWRNASEQEKNTYRMKLEQHRTKVNAIVEKNMIEKMKMVKQQKVVEEMRRREEEDAIRTHLEEIDSEENSHLNNEQGSSSAEHYEQSDIHEQKIFSSPS